MSEVKKGKKGEIRNARRDYAAWTYMEKLRCRLKSKDMIPKRAYDRVDGCQKPHKNPKEAIGRPRGTGKSTNVIKKRVSSKGEREFRAHTGADLGLKKRDPDATTDEKTRTVVFSAPYGCKNRLRERAREGRVRDSGLHSLTRRLEGAQKRRGIRQTSLLERVHTLSGSAFFRSQLLGYRAGNEN